MTVHDIVERLELTVLSGNNGLNREVTNGYVSDLLSDVLGFAQKGDVWVTLQTHKNVMAIASLKDVAAVILVKGLRPDEDTAEVSNVESIPVLGTSLSTFEIVGKLYGLIAKLTK